MSSSLHNNSIILCNTTDDKTRQDNTARYDTVRYGTVRCECFGYQMFLKYFETIFCFLPTVSKEIFSFQEFETREQFLKKNGLKKMFTTVYYFISLRFHLQAFH